MKLSTAQEQGEMMLRARCGRQCEERQRRRTAPRRSVSSSSATSALSFLAVESAAAAEAAAQPSQGSQRTRQGREQQDAPRWGQGVGWVRRLLLLLRTLWDAAVALRRPRTTVCVVLVHYNINVQRYLTCNFL